MPRPTQDEIDEQHNKAIDKVSEGGSNWPGMSYEEGVDATIRWMRGETDHRPMEDE